MTKQPFLALLAASLLCSIASAQTPEPESRIGEVVGKVVDPKGNTVSHAKVCAHRKVFGTLLERPSCVFSNAAGQFNIGIKAPGDFAIAASKEEEFYPDFYSLFRDPMTPFPEVTINEQNTHQEVTAHLGPKGGKLAVKLVEADTGKPVTSGCLEICLAGTDTSCFRTSRSFPGGAFSFLVPYPSFTFRFTRTNLWEIWYTIDGTIQDERPLRALQVAPGTTLELTVPVDSTLPKLGKLVGKFVNAQTGAPVTSGITVEICLLNKSESCLMFVPPFPDGKLSLLIADIPFAIRAQRADGIWYTLNGNAKDGGPLQVHPGAELELIVPLDSR